MADSKSSPILGREICRAVAQATGLQRIRKASVSAEHDDVTIFSVEFIATKEQAEAFGAALMQQAQAQA